MLKEVEDSIEKGDTVDVADFDINDDGLRILALDDFKEWRANSDLNFYDSEFDKPVQILFHSKEAPEVVYAALDRALYDPEKHQMLWSR